MFITIREVFDIVLMTALLGFIFNDTFGVSQKRKAYHLEGIDLPLRRGFNWDGFWFAAAVIAPSVILHELSHKFVAIALGHSATFHAFYADQFTLILGIVAIAAKFLNFGFIFFVPGFVQIAGATNSIQGAWISFAGPCVHLVFWLGSWIILKTRKKMSRTAHHALFVAMRVNMLLFILNMLPIPGIDGWGVYSNLYHVLF